MSEHSDEFIDMLAKWFKILEIANMMTVAISNQTVFEYIKEELKKVNNNE